MDQIKVEIGQTKPKSFLSASSIKHSRVGERQLDFDLSNDIMQ